MSKYITIPLSKGYETIVSIEDADLASLTWYALYGKGSKPYAVRNNPLKTPSHITLHRTIACRIYGELLINGMQVDHIDGNSLNNKRENLRLATQAQNSSNSQGQKRQVDRGYLKGAHYHKRNKYWSSSITVNGVNIHLGTFKSMEEAHEAYKTAAIKYFGEFARWD